MQVYCAHASAVPYGKHGYMVCGLCGKEWYSIDPAPIVVIAVTSVAEVNRYPFEREENENY